MSEWFENDTFWKDMYPFLFSERLLDAADSEVESIVQLIGFSGRTVLDLACGPGRHSIPFAQRGYEVTGVDRTAYYLEKAKANARIADLSIEWIKEDIREFNRQNAFDLALNLYTSLGLFEDDHDIKKVVKILHNSLKPGGVCVLEMASKEWLAKDFQPTVSREAEDGSLLISRHTVIDDWKRIRNEWILIKDGRATSYHFVLTIFSGQELKSLLQEAGFAEIRLYGDYEGNEFGYDSERLVAVARKG